MTRRRRPQSAAPWQACQTLGQILSNFQILSTLAMQYPPRLYRFTSRLWVHGGPRWTHGGSTFCRPAVPRAVLELPKRPFFSSFFWTLIFGRFGSLFLRSGLILETSASQKPMFSLGKTMIYTFAPFPLPARFFIENARKGAKRSPKIE